MAFQKKPRINPVNPDGTLKDMRPKGSKIANKFKKIAVLNELNTIESRKELKRMNTHVYRGAKHNLAGWYKNIPTAKA